MRSGTLIEIDGRPALHFERTLTHSVARVWRAVTEPDELAQWFVAPVSWTPALGETFEAAGQRVTVTELVALLALSQPGVSKHLRILREARLVAVRADGKRRLYRLAPAPLADVDAWLAQYRQLWTERLDALEDHLEANP